MQVTFIPRTTREIFSRFKESNGLPFAAGSLDIAWQGCAVPCALLNKVDCGRTENSGWCKVRLTSGKLAWVWAHDDELSA